MGKFVYEGEVRADFEDRLLAHLQIVMRDKLRRGEAFFFTWKEDVSIGGGRVAVWVHPGASLTFRFHGSRTPSLSREWVDALMYTANGPAGLYIVPEPPPGAAPRDVIG